MQYLGLIMSLALGLTLLLSGIAKIFDLRASARIVASVGILPNLWAKVFGRVLPFVEVVLALLLICGIYVQISLVLSLALFLSFIIANVYVILQGKDIACNCFGRLLSGTMGWGGVYHSLILLCCGAVAIVSPSLSIRELVETSGMFETALVFVPTGGIFLIGLISRESIIYS